MGYLNALTNNWGGGTATALSGLDPATTVAFKLCFRGDLVNDAAAFDTSNIVRVTAGTGDKFTATGITDGTPTNVTLRVASNTGDTADATIARATFASGTFYVWYGHIRPSGSPTVYSEVFTLAGTSLGSGQITYGVTVGTGGGSVAMLDGGGPLQRYRGGVDGLAIYTAVLSGADRYSTPTAGDANLAALYWFDETSGSTAAAAVGNAMTLAGVESTDFAWVAGGTWSPAAPAATPAFGRWRATGPRR